MMDEHEFRRAMRLAGINRTELGAILGKSPNTVSRWTRGELPVPQYANAYLTLLSLFNAVSGAVPSSSQLRKKRQLGT
jgi:transcriptional regulator with XRE-family HTH domain